MKESTIKFVSDVSAVLMILYIGLLLFGIGYGLGAGASFSIGRMQPEEAWEYMSNLAKQSELDQRFVMATLINIRINIAGWYAIWLTCLYGLVCMPWPDRAVVHLLAALANLDTLAVHVYHISGRGAPLVPPDDPYHYKPLPGDSLVAVTNVVALVLILLWRSQRGEQQQHAKTK